MDDKALIEIPASDVATYDPDAAWKSSTQGGKYLSRLQLMTSNSAVCKEGKFAVNHYAVIRDQNFLDAGTEVTVLVIAWRPKAIEMGAEVISVFDPNHAEFKRIQEASGEKDSQCMFGPEFLLWLPEQDQFVTFFMGSKSARREAPNLRAYERMQTGAVLKAKKITTPKYTWFAPIVERCTVPFDLPEAKDIAEQYNTFIKPEARIIEKVDEADASARVR
jgi:hypothetical protein